MSLHFGENRYPGVNAHLTNFLLQPGGGWESFHSGWITSIQEALDEILPPNYYSLEEKSLQMVHRDQGGGVKPRRPDASIFQRPTERSAPASPLVVATDPTQVMPLENVAVAIDDDVMRVGVYEFTNRQVPGKLVTAIEVLSPANKPPATFSGAYRERRNETLAAGVNLVEIDLIHTRRPVVELLPSYPDREEGAQPTLVLVSRPHPSLQEGEFRIYAVGIADPLPKVAVPLLGDDEIVLHLQATYNQRIARTRLFQIVVDYADDPVHIAHYSDADQTQIRDLLAGLRQQPPSQPRE